MRLTNLFYSRVLLSLGLVLIACSLLVLAEPAQAFEARPPLVEMTAEPGGVTSSTFTIKNTEEGERTFAFTIQGFVSAGLDGEARFLPPSETAGLPSWLYLSRGSVRLQAQEEVSVPFFFRPPGEARAGSYQAVIFATTLDARQGEGVRLGSRIGVLVLATVAGEARRDLTAESFRRTSPAYVDRGMAMFEVGIRNSGEVHETPQGAVVLTNLWGKEVASLSLQATEQPKRILPRSSRVFALTWKDGGEFRFGIYRARAELEEPIRQSSKSQWVFVVPWQVFGGFIVACTLFFAACFGWPRWRSLLRLER